MPFWFVQSNAACSAYAPIIQSAQTLYYYRANGGLDVAFPKFSKKIIIIRMIELIRLRIISWQWCRHRYHIDITPSHVLRRNEMSQREICNLRRRHHRVTVLLKIAYNRNSHVGDFNCTLVDIWMTLFRCPAALREFIAKINEYGRHLMCHYAVAQIEFYTFRWRHIPHETELRHTEGILADIRTTPQNHLPPFAFTKVAWLLGTLFPNCITHISRWKYIAENNNKQ